MAVIKKKDKSNGAVPEVKAWSAQENSIPITKVKRILRGKEAPLQSMNQAIPQLDLARKGPYIEPIEENGAIVGVVLTCKCGERSTLYFDYDDGSQS